VLVEESRVLAEAADDDCDDNDDNDDDTHRYSPLHLHTVITISINTVVIHKTGSTYNAAS